MSETPPIPTLADVAALAGVSTATVSRCLNATSTVSRLTKEKVMQAVDHLGYTPNFGARAMALTAKRTQTIGVIVPTLENAIFAQGLQAIQDTLAEAGYTLLVSSTGYRSETEAAQIQTMAAHGVDGLVLIGQARAPEIYATLARRSVPVVLTWAFDSDATQITVGFDNHAAMRSLAMVVFGLGHQDVGIISGHTKDNDRAAERIAGIKDAALAYGLDPERIPVQQTAYGICEGQDALHALLDRRPNLTAVLCGNDVLAVGAMKAAQQREISVPRDLSITGFDDLEIAQVVYPPLTTVHVPHEEMGRRAAKQLLAMITQDAEGSSERLACTLRLRGSLAAPR